ncbi:MAG TPA: hypothetical protein VFZ78_11900 [Flavisolibacter sp.]
MNRFSVPALLILFLVAAMPAVAQDTLPKFSVRHIGNNKVIIGWVNNYPLTKQISIQRSHDSLRNFTTIMSVADPNAIQNGFADLKAPNDHMYYRLFINLDKGAFLFTESKQPVLDTFRTVDPVMKKIRDTLRNGRKPDFIPSYYVYTNRDGYVFINLPDADKKKYHIKFYEENGTMLFELKAIRQTALTLDKANFMHAGWFHFELYNDDKLVEKNKFYLAKDF